MPGRQVPAMGARSSSSRSLSSDAVFSSFTLVKVLCSSGCRRTAKVPPNATAPRKSAPEITAEALEGDPVCCEVRRRLMSWYLVRLTAAWCFVDVVGAFCGQTGQTKKNEAGSDIKASSQASFGMWMESSSVVSRGCPLTTAYNCEQQAMHPVRNDRGVCVCRT